MAVTPDDFPRGFAETNRILTRLKWDIKPGWIYDAGLTDYGEFFTSLEYGWELMQRPMVSLNGKPGRLKVACRFENGVQLKWSPVDGTPVRSPNLCPFDEDAA